MGRSAGWLAYGAAIAGEASLVISVEDITGKYEASEEVTDPKTGKTTIRRVMDVRRSHPPHRRHDARPRRGRRQGIRRDRHRRRPGRVPAPTRTSKACPATSTATSPSRSSTSAASSPSLVAKEYTKQTGKKRKITGLQLGYECRCAQPQAFDVMLGSQLGVGAYRALVEKRLDGVMVSVSGQLDLNYVPFSQLVDPGHAGHGRPLHRARQRLPPAGAVLGNVRERLSGRWRSRNRSTGRELFGWFWHFAGRKAEFVYAMWATLQNGRWLLQLQVVIV